MQRARIEVVSSETAEKNNLYRNPVDIQRVGKTISPGMVGK